MGGLMRVLLGDLRRQYAPGCFQTMKIRSATRIHARRRRSRIPRSCSALVTAPQALTRRSLARALTRDQSPPADACCRSAEAPKADDDGLRTAYAAGSWQQSIGRLRGACRIAVPTRVSMNRCRSPREAERHRRIDPQAPGRRDRRGNRLGQDHAVAQALPAAGRGAAGLIGCTQPRRIAARAVARRVAEELNVELGGAVGFQVRFNDQVGERTATSSS
jgi:ATP-dependent helicase HrpA